MKPHLPWLAAVFGVVLVATWPLAAQFGSAAVGHPYGDMPDHYWGTWWFGREVLLGRLPVLTDVSHFPDALALWYVDPVGALTAFPARFLGFPADWNFLLLVNVLATALAGYFAGHDLTGDRAAGLVSAVVIGASPYLLGLLHSGLSEFIGLAPVTLYAWALVRTLGFDPRGRPPPPRGELLAAVLLGLCGTTSLYYFLFGALLAACAIPGAGWRDRLPRVARIATMGTVLTVPAAAVSLSLLGGAVSPDNAPGWAARLPATDLLTFVRPGAYYFPNTPAEGNPGILHVNYLGWVAILLAAGGALGSFRRFGLLFGVFVLGPRLALAGSILTIGSFNLLLPLGLLYFPGSPFGWIHQPYRIVAFFLPWLGMAAALGAARLPARIRPLLAAAALAETILASPAVWPLATRDMTPPEAHLALEPGAILDWPPDGSTWNRDYLVWATQHGQPVPYGVNVFLGETLRKDPLVDGLLRALLRIESRARNRDVPFQGRLLLRPVGTQTQLGRLGFAWVLVHKDALDDREWGRTRGILREAFGEPHREDPEVAVWAVR